MSCAEGSISYSGKDEDDDDAIADQNPDDEDKEVWQSLDINCVQCSEGKRGLTMGVSPGSGSSLCHMRWKSLHLH